MKFRELFLNHAFYADGGRLYVKIAWSSGSINAFEIRPDGTIQGFWFGPDEIVADLGQAKISLIKE